MQRCWKEIHRSCSQEDALQKGHISTTCFLGEQETKHTQLFFTCVHTNSSDVCALCIADILHSLNINVSQVQFERLAVKFNIMNNGSVSYHNFLRHFLLNLTPGETRRTFERCRLPLPVTPVMKKYFIILHVSVCIKLALTNESNIYNNIQVRLVT